MPSKRGDEGHVFGAHLRALLLQRKLTQQQLADRCGSNEPFISNLERGVKIPSLSMLLRLAEALEVRPSSEALSGLRRRHGAAPKPYGWAADGVVLERCSQECG